MSGENYHLRAGKSKIICIRYDPFLFEGVIKTKVKWGRSAFYFFWRGGGQDFVNLYILIKGKPIVQFNNVTTIVIIFHCYFFQSIKFIQQFKQGQFSPALAS